ncbi:hypothetical protein DOTSEDRAFT_83088 [Dothistroma septosporum NZE10]|uniref:Uncharacterized protein n=1 Tax=Dothistroma septosporum (strain NZE10 / CBS 128990) TaxID=675120 RepID=M2XIJ6_DOTSN|nr:hypothetical protein DOTSEDRAFT_83088 [Dothistroma septosporum NZE10]
MAGVLNRPVHLILDYDGTLTIRDTMSVLGKLPKDPRMAWRDIEEAYIKDHQQYKNEHFDWIHYDHTEYSKWLMTRKAVEQKSAKRVQDACFFRGVTHEDVNNRVDESLCNGELQFRAGWLDLFALFLANYDPTVGMPKRSRISILSVNWSEAAIRRSLWQAARLSDHPKKAAICCYINDMDIRANEIEGLGSPNGSSGRVCRPLPSSDIRTSDDKLVHMNAMRDAQITANGDDHHCAGSIIYVGDSSTDFDSLCAADLGVWLYDVDESEYKETFTEVFKPLQMIPPISVREVTRLQSSDGPAWSPLLAWDRNFDGLVKLFANV